MLQALPTDVEEAEEFIGRLRCFNEVLAEMPRTFRVTERERESCLEAEWDLAAALDGGRSLECSARRSRAEAAAESLASALAERPHVRPEFKHALLEILRGGESALSPELLSGAGSQPYQCPPAAASRFAVAAAFEREARCGAAV